MKGNTTRVVVIDPYRPDEMQFGVSDLIRKDDLYVKVYFDDKKKDVSESLICAAYVFLASSSDKVQTVFLRHQREQKALRDRQYEELMKVQAEHGAR